MIDVFRILVWPRARPSSSMARYVMHEGVLISSFAIHAIHPCMPALYVADVASDAIGELYSSHTYVVEPGYVPDYENNRL